MRCVSVVERVELDASVGSVMPAAICVDDVDNDGANELILGTVDGSVYIYAATAGVGLVILGLVHYLMCLTANYAMIKDGAKLRFFCLSALGISLSVCLSLLPLSITSCASLPTTP